jgi:hypothetical protein
MPINIHNCSVYCRDCNKIVIEGATVSLKAAIGANLPLLEGTSVTKSGDHHTKFRHVTGNETTTKRHSDMILLEGNRKIGEFTTSGIARQVGIVLSDPGLAAELNVELQELMREDELRRRGSNLENR